MGFATKYLEKQEGYSPSFLSAPLSELRMIVVIPCYNEPDILLTLASLQTCTSPKYPVEVLIVVNSSESTPEEIKKVNQETADEIKAWSRSNSSSNMIFHAINITNIRPKHHGAGLARKIGMDQAVARFNLINQANGIIISLDADTLVEKNYLIEIEKKWDYSPEMNLATINFAHPLEGRNYTKDHYDAIAMYELHMRYYKLGLEYADFPYVAYTIGSAFAVKASTYVKQGGMNKKQAGEDFYFIQKILPLGNFAEINTTTVYPSPRLSKRVPFGTGPMIEKIIKDGQLESYNFEFFEYLKAFTSSCHLFYKADSSKIDRTLQNLPQPVTTFLKIKNIDDKIEEINQNVSGKDAFIKRFYQWCNAFFILKMNNYIHENYLEKVSIIEMANKYLEETNQKKLITENPRELLINIRILTTNH